MVDFTSRMTYKLEFDKGDRRITKYFHNQRPLKRKFKKEIDNTPVMYFYQDGKWIGLDTN